MYEYFQVLFVIKSHSRIPQTYLMSNLSIYRAMIQTKWKWPEHQITFQNMEKLIKYLKISVKINNCSGVLIIFHSLIVDYILDIARIQSQQDAQIEIASNIFVPNMASKSSIQSQHLWSNSIDEKEILNAMDVISDKDVFQLTLTS